MLPTPTRLRQVSTLLITAALTCLASLRTVAAGLITAPNLIQLTTISDPIGPIVGGGTLARQDGRYFVATMAGQNGTPVAKVRAWRSDNSTLWTWNTPGNEGIDIVPTLNSDATRLFVATTAGKVYCLDASTPDSGGQNPNRVIWSVNLGSVTTTLTGTFPVHAQLAISIDGSTLYVRTSQTKSADPTAVRSYLFAIFLSDFAPHTPSSSDLTGRLAWNPVPIYDNLPNTEILHSFPHSSGPTVATTGNIYFGTQTGHLLGISSAGSVVFDLNLGTSQPVLDRYHSIGYTDSPTIVIEANPAINDNGVVYIATRQWRSAVNLFDSKEDAIIAAVDPTLPAASSIRWLNTVSTDDPAFPKGVIASPIIDRAGFVYVTCWGHHIEQFDSTSGLQGRVWNNSSSAGAYITGKLYQTPALTDDGFLVIAESGAVDTGKADIAALPTEGSTDPMVVRPLWEYSAAVLDNGAEYPNYYGSPAISSTGAIYIADSMGTGSGLPPTQTPKYGRVFKIAGKSPLMDAPWPSLAGGNARNGRGSTYSQSFFQFFGYGSYDFTIRSLDNANRSIGTTFGASPTFYWQTTMWNPAAANVFPNWYAFGTASDVVGDVGAIMGSGGIGYQAAVFPLGAYNQSVAPVSLPVPSTTQDYQGNTVTIVQSFVSGFSEDRFIVGGVNNQGATVLTPIRWRLDSGSYTGLIIRPPAGNRASVSAVGTSGWAVGHAYFVSSGAYYHAFKLVPDALQNAFQLDSPDLGTLPGGGSSVALDIREDYGIVGKSQNAGGNWRAFLMPFRADINDSRHYNSISTAGIELPPLANVGSGPAWTSSANSLNRKGIVVGTSQISNGAGGYTGRATMWVPTGNGGYSSVDLNGYAPVGGGWILTSALKINDQGTIVGIGSKNGVSSAFLIMATRGQN